MYILLEPNDIVKNTDEFWVIDRWIPIEKCFIGCKSSQVIDPVRRFVENGGALSLTVSNDVIDAIYQAYPARCPTTGRNLGKGLVNKRQIEKLIKTGRYTAKKLYLIQKAYIAECQKSGEYMKNYSTFLNNVPDSLISESTPEKRELVQ